LYRYPGPCYSVLGVPLWTDSAGRTVIGVLLVTQKDKTVSRFGLFAGGRFIPLPALAVSPQAQPVVAGPGSIAF
ncbi:MAG TPA: hypothetical protein VGD91_02565, partial [Trebonia sp.]